MTKILNYMYSSRDVAIRFEKITLGWDLRENVQLQYNRRPIKMVAKLLKAVATPVMISLNRPKTEREGVGD